MLCSGKNEFSRAIILPQKSDYPVKNIAATPAGNRVDSPKKKVYSGVIHVITGGIPVVNRVLSFSSLKW
jgi:hypothetical protein